MLRHACIAAGLSVFAAWLDFVWWGPNYDTRHIVWVRLVIGLYGVAVGTIGMLQPRFSTSERIGGGIATLICALAAASAVIIGRVIK